jgi:hypothetical protein
MLSMVTDPQLIDTVVSLDAKLFASRQHLLDLLILLPLLK